MIPSTDCMPEWSGRFTRRPLRPAAGRRLRLRGIVPCARATTRQLPLRPDRSRKHAVAPPASRYRRRQLIHRPAPSSLTTEKNLTLRGKINVCRQSTANKCSSTTTQRHVDHAHVSQGLHRRRPRGRQDVIFVIVATPLNFFARNEHFLNPSVNVHEQPTTTSTVESIFRHHRRP